MRRGLKHIYINPTPSSCARFNLVSSKSRLFIPAAAPAGENEAFELNLEARYLTSQR